MIREHGDVAVLGAGFAGSMMALVLQRIGRTVVLLERGCSSALRHRRILDTAGQPCPGGDEPRLRPAPVPPVRRIRKLAEGVSPPGGGVEARLHLHAAPGGPALPAHARNTPTSCWWPPARRTTSLTRTGSGSISTISWCKKPSRQASPITNGRTSPRSSATRQHWLLRGQREGEPSR